jgi:Anti-sigma-K factor rskA, C-terminal/Putative zinc-finger
MSTQQPLTHEQAVDLAPLYVLGALEEAEMGSVREHLATCPESHAEFEELGGVVPYLLDDPSLELVEPPAALGDRIMAAAAADLAARSAPVAERTTPVAERTTPAAERTTPAAIPFPSADEREARAERTRARTSPLEWAVRIAAVVAIVALGAYGFRLQGQVNDLEAQVAAAENFRSAVAAVLDVAAQEGSQTAVLTPVESGGPRGLAAVASDGSIQFAMEDLAPTSGNQVYETWAIVGDAAPVPLGSFTVDTTGVASFTSKQGPTDPGIVVAVSREPAAGATTPTEVVSAGAATTPG